MCFRRRRERHERHIVRPIDAFDLLKPMASTDTIDPGKYGLDHRPDEYMILSEYHESIPIDDRLMKNDRVR